MKLRTVIAVISVLVQAAVFAQNEGAKWYFHAAAGLDFMTSPPTNIVNSAMGAATSFNEGTSSIADANGNLLFYTDGLTIWNKANNIMANGSGLLGHVSTSQAALIVKQPGNASIYFVFTQDEAVGLVPDGLRYSTVDMSLAAGMGSVTVKNTLLFAANTEKLCGVRHCNGIDVWVLSHDYPGTGFRANLVTALGVNPVPVISSIGTNIALASNTQGCLKASPSGKKLGLGIQSLSAGGAYTGAFELYDFDNATGVVSNSLSLGTNFLTAYGCEFSPDGTKFYGAPRNGSEIYQWNLCAGSNSAIVASQYTQTALNACQMQLANDGKIYIARNNQTWLGVINAPNASGNAMNYNAFGQNISPRNSSEGLPNFVSSYFREPPPPFTYTLSCYTVSFTAPVVSNTLQGCAFATDSIVAYNWYFGDPVSGTANTSSAQNPTHAYSASGIFTVQLVLYNSCQGVIDTLKQQVIVSAPASPAISADTVCAGQTLNLYAGLSNGVSYSWAGPNGFSSFQQNPSLANASVVMNGVYSVTVVTLDGCTSDSSVIVMVMPGYTAQAASNAPCAFQTLSLTAGAGAFFQWTGPNNFNSSLQAPVISNVNPSAAGHYTLVSGIGSCKDTAIVLVTVHSLPAPIASNSGTVCEHELLQLMVTNSGLTYSWAGPNNYVSSLQNPTLTALSAGSGIYIVTVTDANNCEASTTTSVVIIEAPLATVWPAKSCSGQQVNLSGSGGNSYVWTGPSGFSASGQNVSFTAIGTGMGGIYTLTTLGNSNCSATATVLVTVYGLPSATVAAQVKLCAPFCEQVRLKDNAGVSLKKIRFQVNNEFFSDSTLIYCFKKPGGYFVKANFADSNNCVGSSTLFINAYERPDANFECMPLKPLAGINTVTFTNTSSGIEQTNWTWFFIDNTKQSLEGERVSYAFETPGKFPVALVVKNKWECTDTIVKDLMIEDGFSFYVPNAFTPNGDGHNDGFQPKGNGIKTYRLMIFDRWGTRLFETEDFLTPWDGLYNGVLCKTDVYIWKITFTGSDAKVRELQGHVTLYK